MNQTLCGMALLVLACSSANASLDSRSGGLAYYDTDTNLTWVADANLAKTSGSDADGLMTWTQAVGWVSSLRAVGYLGRYDWRLPTVTDTGTPGCDYGYTGTDCGYNVDLSTGEMARMFYGTLGNMGYYDTSGGEMGCSYPSPQYCMANVGPFSNLDAYLYWSGTEYAPDTGHAWLFDSRNGGQARGPKANVFRAWAVLTGDSAAVPVPPAVWLFGSALGLMGVMRRRANCGQASRADQGGVPLMPVNNQR